MNQNETIIEHRNPEFSEVALSLSSALGFAVSIGSGFEGFYAFSVASAVFGLFAGMDAGKMFILRSLNNNDRRNVTKHPGKYPYETSTSVTFEDTNGLELLLEKTAEKSPLEWGTAFNVRRESNTSVISSILDPKEAMERKYIFSPSRTSLGVDREKITEHGYQGLQHYHPPQRCSRANGHFNFNVSETDRFLPTGGLGLLTFNLSGGPEIIAFNLSSVYIPTDKTKRELVIASPADIQRYLRYK